MRPDVKLGIIVSLVVVTVMGGYYLYRGNREAPILVDELDASDLVNNDKARAKNTNNGNIGKKNSASTKRQAATRRDLQTARRNTVNSARKSGQAGTPPSSIPSNQRQSRRQSSSSPLSRTPAATRQASTSAPNITSGSPKTKMGPKVPSATRSIPQNRAASNTQTNQPTAGSILANTTARKSVPLMATSRAANRAALETHRVLPGETLASIAEMYYGNTQLAQLLLKANPAVNTPSSLRVGMLIKIPSQENESVADRANKKSSLVTPAKKIADKNYIVKSGDSLFVIAKRELGNGARWKEIFELNKQALGSNPNRLKVGQTLAMPAS